MYRSISDWGILFLFVVAIGIYGCSSPTVSTSGTSDSSTPVTPEPEATGGGDQAGHEGHEGHTEHVSDAGDTSSDMEKMKEGLAELSEADRASAEKQHVCPVSGKMLGTMGTPVKVTVNDREVWLCCAGCEGQLREKPEEYLAKLAK